MRKEYYHTYKQLGICTACGKEKAEEGKVLCFECAIKDANRKRTYDKKRKQEYNKRKKELCDAFGICTTCMKREKYKGKRCIECYLKAHRKYKEKQIEEGKIPRNLWDEFELCAICGKPRYKNSKLCKEHLDTARKNALNARNYIDRDNHAWKKENDISVKYTQTFLQRRKNMIYKQEYIENLRMVE